jgi:hypothetical protein
MMIHTTDNKTFSGTSAEAIVQKMLESNAFTCAKTVEEYMQSVAGRYSTLCNIHVRDDKPESFLDDLHSCGAIYLTFGN